MFKILYSPIFKEHKPLNYHPENPKRLDFAIAGLKAKNIWKNIVEPTPASIDEILEVHSENYVEKIRKASQIGFHYIDPDTYICEKTWDAALYAFGAAREAALIALEEKGIFLALVRPPGHHAGKSGRAFYASTLGFCIFNNVAGAAKLLETLEGNALIIDFDVHHGNGTQEIFWNDANVVHIDLHERDIYPWSGYEWEVGGKEAEGTKINIPMTSYSGDDDYIFAWHEIVMPIVNEVKPKVILISAGFDAFKGDGLATIQLTEEFYRFAGTSLSGYSLAVVLEGGYSIGLEKGLPAFIEGYLKGETEEETIKPSYEALKVVGKVKEILREWWEI
ncbi:histone deacetylase family protein [Thermococcus paralvinellae]|uniref:Acetylpolyamine aminohydrolase n=1 Tax=Thermococcus paralvinellae TaxID=582419 RepID=W0I8C7_9EURY|nr:histone deacetylase family protein [Thermococcus paralvinellae]AHF80720.1 acetylpolyamine aminohydrolase [Thermococcus paralvinellae]